MSCTNMTLIYRVSEGRFYDHGGKMLYICYSGKRGRARNDSAYEKEANEGPIPQGRYLMGRPYHSAKVGPLAIPLSPTADTDTFGRSAFLIHGDNAEGDASEGCVIAPRPLRHALASHLEKPGHTITLYVLS